MSHPRTYTDKEVKSTFSQIDAATSAEWVKKEKKAVTELHHSMASRVPAYRDFLTKQGIDVSKKHAYREIVGQLPAINKKNYVHAHSRTDLFWDGNPKHPGVYTATSGSTGKPTYFVRSHGVDQQSSMIHELFYRTSCDPDRSTLVIVCFGMGIWIGGVITYHAFQQIADRGNPVSIITPGINMQEILRALKEVAPQYEQVILCGYPPFIKDVIDESYADKIPVKKLNIKLLMAAEPFTDRFRLQIARRIGSKNPYRDIMNIYGTADIGTMAFETPISALIRKIAVDKKKVFRALFGETTRTPTFAQFVPSFTSFSERSGELFVHGDSVMPLVNYAVGDRGGVLTFDEVHKRLKKEGIEIKKIAKEYGISDTVREMPFVFVYERIDFSTSLYGLQIYPEPVREAILMRPFSTHCTGKCALEAEFDEEQNQYLRVHVELQGSEALPAGLTKILIKHIVKQIETKNAEYRELVKHVGVRAHPKITFWPRGDEKYFKQGIKQKWVV